MNVNHYSYLPLLIFVKHQRRTYFTGFKIVISFISMNKLTIGINVKLIGA